MLTVSPPLRPLVRGRFFAYNVNMTDSMYSDDITKAALERRKEELTKELSERSAADIVDAYQPPERPDQREYENLLDRFEHNADFMRFAEDIVAGRFVMDGDRKRLPTLAERMRMFSLIKDKALPTLQSVEVGGKKDAPLTVTIGLADMQMAEKLLNQAGGGDE